MVGASSPSDTGLFYQWGDIIGYTEDSGYNFNIENYVLKNLNQITTNLDNAHDAARAYYGPSAKMPSLSDFEELINNCHLTYLGNGLYMITSNINGASIRIRANGFITNINHESIEKLRVWSSNIGTIDMRAYAFHIDDFERMTYDQNTRNYGYNIMAVHS